jgi:hypothetical protein
MRALAGAGAAAALAMAAPATASALAVAPAATVATGSHVVGTTGGTVALHKIGTVSIRALAAADRARSSNGPNAPSAPSAHPTRETPLRLPPYAGHTANSAAANASRQSARNAATLRGFTGNVPGARGFDGLTSAINSSANSPGFGGAGDVSPPDQGLAVGPSPEGTVIVEFINQSLDIYSSTGKSLLGAVPGFQLYGLPATAFLSDPRAYWDPQTQHWFLTMFTVGTLNSDGTVASPSDQYIAVSQTTDPFGPYSVFSFDTTDASTAGCPCFGDFDQVGADNTGFYIATNEFSIAGPAFNGADVYAMPKRGLIAAAGGSAPAPVIQLYRVPTASDPYGSYHLSPSSVPQGASSPNTEYFVESNGNSNYGSGLEVFALLGTSVLSSGGRPAMAEAPVATEQYSAPPNAYQETGPVPYGQSLGSEEGQLQTDFDAVQQVSYAGGRLYAELSTGFNYGTGQNSGVSWFVLHPSVSASSVTTSLVSDGYVKTSQDLLYPVIGVNSAGHGYLGFSVSGVTRYPSAAYVTFEGSKGATGAVHIAAPGAGPLDDFTCYPPFSTGQCRYGDYSMAQVYNGKIYLATEYVAPQPRDVLSDWGTRIWDAPVP